MKKLELNKAQEGSEPLSELNLSIRVYDILINAGYESIQEIYNLSNKELKAIEGMDTNYINEILHKIHLFEKGITQEKMFKEDVLQLWKECKEQKSFEPLNPKRTIRGKNIKDSKVLFGVYLLLFEKYIKHVSDRIDQDECPLSLEAFVKTLIVIKYEKYKWVIRLNQNNDIVKRTISSAKKVQEYKSERSSRKRNVRNRRLEYETRPSKIFSTV